MEGEVNHGDQVLNNNNDKECLPYFMDYLPENFRRKAEKELNETEERRVEGVKTLKERIKSSKILKDIEFHDDALQLFLRHSKYDIDRTLNRMENYVSFRRKHPMFNAVSKEMFEKIKSANIFPFLPVRDPNGCVTFMIKYANWNPSEVPWKDFTSYAMMVLHQLLRDPMTQISGIITLHDFKGLSMKAVSQFTPYNSYVVTKAFLDCIPARYKTIHVINQPAIFKLIWAILRPLFSEKLKKRMIFHSSQEELLDHYPLCMLPPEYGGNLNEKLYETQMSNWLRNASEQQRKCTEGGQSNFY